MGILFLGDLMGARTKNARDRRRTGLSRSIWKEIEREFPEKLDIDAADHMVDRVCDAVRLVIEDMKSVAEFNRLGYCKRHWYALELHISDREIAAQNTLEGAEPFTPHLPPLSALALWQWHKLTYV